MSDTPTSEFKQPGAARAVLGAAVGMAFGVSGLSYFTLGLFAKPVGETFGLSRGEVQGAITANTLGVVLAAYFVGRLCDRYGARRVAIGSIIGLAVGMIGIALVTQGILTWWASWFIMAIMGAGTSPIVWTRGVAGWFDRRRGIALGLALLGSGGMAIVGPPVATRLIEAFGWRGAYLALAGCILAIALPLLILLFREKPGASGASSVRPPGASAAAAIADRRFWIMIAGFGFISFGIGGLVPSLASLLTDKGLTPMQAAGYMSAIGLSVIAGRLISGAMLDRFWAPLVAFVFLCGPAISCVLLAGPLPSPVLIAVAVALLGLAGGAEFDLIAFMVARYFGMRSYGQIYAWQYIWFAITAGIAPVVFGAAFDAAGSYQPILLVAAAGFIIGPLILFALGPYPKTYPNAEASDLGPAA